MFQVPVIISQSSKSDFCPDCGKVEEIVKACKWCGRVYSESSSFLVVIISILIIVLIVVFIFWIMLTIIEWSMEGGSLQRVFEKQVEWLNSMSIFKKKDKWGNMV